MSEYLQDLTGYWEAVAALQEAVSQGDLENARGASAALTDLSTAVDVDFIRGDLVKAVIDLERRIMIVDADLHADQEAELLAGGSRQQDLWGINFYPDLPASDWLEFDSMINLRPSFGNRSRGVEDPATREKIAALVRDLVRR